MNALPSLSFIDDEAPRVIMFCGKGGVGKTTCAAATAFHTSRAGLKTLLLSTDPTPSLSDILEADVRREPKKVAANLFAVELDYDSVVDMWKGKFGPEVYEVISSFLPVGEEIIDYVAGAPGIDEEFALSYVLDAYESGSYDVIVWDTAPAGGTLTLVKLQEKFYEHLGEAARLYVKVKRALEALTKGRVKRDPLSLIESWRDLAARVLAMLRDEKTYAIVVTIAEALGVRLTERAISELASFGINVRALVVNYVVGKCTCEFHAKRAAMQAAYIEELRARYGKDRVVMLPQLPYEVKGMKAISEVERLLFKPEESALSTP